MEIRGGRVSGRRAMMANSCTRKKSDGTSLGGMGSEGRNGQEEEVKQQDEKGVCTVFDIGLKQYCYHGKRPSRNHSEHYPVLCTINMNLSVSEEHTGGNGCGKRQQREVHRR